VAKAGDEIQHPVTGERITWRSVASDTGGELLQADLYALPQATPAAAHIHPHQEERFEVVRGTLKLDVAGVVQILHAGDTAVVPKGTPHTWWNVGEDEAHIVADVRPALRTELFFETFFGLANDGKTNRRGMPNLLQFAAIAREFEDEVRLAKPSAAVQRVVFTPLAILARLMGYRGWYPRYSATPMDKRQLP
jgi:quercetin dioxygenase-like cupin family protein